jgi:hypothetical protein
MAILSNLVVGLFQHHGFPYLPGARRYYAASLGEAVALALRANSWLCYSSRTTGLTASELWPVLQMLESCGTDSTTI